MVEGSRTFFLSGGAGLCSVVLVSGPVGLVSGLWSWARGPGLWSVV